MSIRYFGNKDIRLRVEELLIEMLEDTELSYTISIHESRENEKISKLVIEVSNVENSMPNF